MIILPDKNICRTKFLMPVPKREWLTPSQAQPKDEFGKENKTFFCIRGRLNDGYLKWRGIFDDRDDFDAFLYAMVSGSLRYERELWRLPWFEWHPDFGEHLTYDFATEVALTSSPGSTLTYTSPSDWNNSDNKIELVGGGAGGGAARQASSIRATGGGGGGFARDTNFSFATPGTTTASYFIGVGGAGATASTSGTAVAGSGGSNTWFSSTSELRGGGGGGGQAIVSSTSALSGGTAGAGGGTIAVQTYSGGRGGNISAFSNTNYVSTGAGGAAGINGAGGNGTDITSPTSSPGGTGDNGTGGAGGTGGVAGSNGTEWGTTATYGSGGGAGQTGGTTPGPTGGLYGAGGGPNLRGAVAAIAGAGRQGLIYITYTPTVSSSIAYTNLPMLGM